MYYGEPARLLRRRLERSWALWHGVYFTAERPGYAAMMFDRIWREHYGGRPGAPPPRMQMPIEEVMRLLGVPANYTREDIIAAFRRQAKRAHPDADGSAELSRKLVDARNRLLVSSGSWATPPRMPEFAPKGIRMRYGRVKFSVPRRLGHTRRLASA
jgi:hypothetical protein